MMNKLALVFSLISLIEAAPWHSIVAPPSDVVGKLGGTAEFRCQLGFANVMVMGWEFNSNIIYSMQNNNEDYPKGSEKYLVTRDGSYFTLKIKSLQLTDGGRYTCTVPAGSEEAYLIVMDTPQLSISTSNPVEGTAVRYSCTARFTGRRKDISLEHHPQLQMFFNGQPLEGKVQEDFDPVMNYHQLTQIHDLTLETSMNGKELLCDIGAPGTMTHLKATEEVKVQYAVRNITYTPHSQRYEVGLAIYCTADGSPEPDFIWDDIEHEGNIVRGGLLQITKNMVGSNVWRCSAWNIVSGHPNQESVLTIFDVVLPGEHGIQKSGYDAWVYAVGIAIPTCMIIGCLVMVFMCCDKKHLKNLWPGRPIKGYVSVATPGDESPIMVKTVPFDSYKIGSSHEDHSPGEIPSKTGQPVSSKAEGTLKVTKSGLPVGNIAESLAWAYYFNYINIIGPEMVKKMEAFLQTEKGSQGHMPKKIFILLPSSCRCYPRLENADRAIKSVGSLDPLWKEMAGNNRVYDPPLYEIASQGQSYFICVEYCASLHVLYEMGIKGTAEFSKTERQAQFNTFHHLLEKLMKESMHPQFCQSVRLVAYDDTNGKPLSEILMEEIKQCL